MAEANHILKRIHQLPAFVANQIAAGEVIERPASVVKELLENALDAGATAINIEIGFGGLNQIKICDNGTGILADDLPLAIAAHATSKICKLNDLYAITSMGFRGEALASIASISRIVVCSKPAEQAHAMMMRLDDGVVCLTPCARSQGTTIDVRDLFFNAPVRKKFLKSERSEYQAIETIVKRFALSSPSIAITLTHNDKQTLVLPPASCEQTLLMRIKKLLGKKFIDEAIYLNVERAGMRLEGWVSSTDFQCSQNDKQWIYINQRMVKDKLLSHALKQVYEGRLHPGRHAACLLYLSVPAHELDVNVHPTKHEVRFQQPRLVHDLITSQISDALAANAPVSNKWDVEFKTDVDNLISLGLDVRESQQTQSAYTAIPNNSSWLVLNSHFAIVNLHGEYYLLDIESVQRCQLMQLLNQQGTPFASRPLLVPVSYVIDKVNYTSIESLQPMLTDLGLQCDFASESRIIIRTIPQLLPLLDIQRFFNGLLESCEQVVELRPINCQQALIEILIKCQSFDARQLTHDEKVGLQIFLHAMPTVLKTSALRMDIEQCRDLFND